MREIRSALRDRTIVTNSVLLPVLLYPLIVWLVYTAVTFVSGQNEHLRSLIMLKDVPAAHAMLKREFETDKSVVLTDSANPSMDIRNGRLDAFVEFVPSASSPAFKNDFAVRVTYDESRDPSQRAKDRVNEKVSRYRGTYLQHEASKLGITQEQYENFAVAERNISSGREVGAFVVVLPIFFIIMLTVGGLHPAIDSTAGERENSTWETVMSSATPRVNVLVAKYLYVATMSFTAAFLNLFAMMFSMGTLLAPLFRGEGSLRIPLSSVPLVLVGAVLLALFVAAGMMILASFARSYKEGQSMVSPFYIALILPILFFQTPGLEFTPRMALIPVANVMMMIREAFQGIYHWRLIGMTLAIEGACVIVALRIAMLMIQHEDFVMGSYSGTFGKFAKERLLRK